ncbi:hypothetical protein CEXT_630851 [Caerostris extrusa]|uniref:Uncharacterized protein n=1 Tax=Caerostris extrusa TaxID=172846 RepID=A0AAV4QB13_CAEEX|nr:hypothetical protein CEXT_630851 [Caerostris extrusa]
MVHGQKGKIPPLKGMKLGELPKRIANFWLSVESVKPKIFNQTIRLSMLDTDKSQRLVFRSNTYLVIGKESKPKGQVRNRVLVFLNSS